MLLGNMHMFANLSMISSSIHAIKEGRHYAKPPHVAPDRIGWLNMETNKLESAVNSERYYCNSAVRSYHIYQDIWEANCGEFLSCTREMGNTVYRETLMKGKFGEFGELLSNR